MTPKEILLIIISLFIFGLILYFLAFQPFFPFYRESEEIPLKNCSVSLSFSVSGFDTCDIKTSILANNCKDKIYEIRNKEVKCSNTIIDDSSIIICDWKVTSGTYTYNLYVNDDYKTSVDIMCPSEFVECTECIC
jgi:hypothetical protein